MFVGSLPDNSLYCTDVLPLSELLSASPLPLRHRFALLGPFVSATVPALHFLSFSFPPDSALVVCLSSVHVTLFLWHAPRVGHPFFRLPALFLIRSLGRTRSRTRVNSQCIPPPFDTVSSLDGCIRARRPRPPCRECIPAIELRASSAASRCVSAPSTGASSGRAAAFVTPTRPRLSVSMTSGESMAIEGETPSLRGDISSKGDERPEETACYTAIGVSSSRLLSPEPCEWLSPSAESITRSAYRLGSCSEATKSKGAVQHEAGAGVQASAKAAAEIHKHPVAHFCSRSIESRASV